MNPKMKQDKYESLLFKMTQQIEEIRDNFQAVLENPLIPETTKTKIREFLSQHNNDDMFIVSDLINSDIDKIIKDNTDICRSDF